MTNDIEASYIANMATDLYESVTYEPVDIHSASITWLDKTGDKLTMRITKNPNGST
jgi:hypothetical protein